MSVRLSKPALPEVDTKPARFETQLKATFSSLISVCFMMSIVNKIPIVVKGNTQPYTPQ